MNFSPKNNQKAESNKQDFNDRFQVSYKIPIEKITYLLCLVTSTAIIISWFIGYEKALSIFSGSATMKFNTAIIFLLIGINFYILHKNENFQKTLYNSISILLIIIGILSILSNYNISFLNIDNIFKVDIFSTEKPGLMSPATAVCGILIGLGFIFLKIKNKSFSKIANNLFLVVNIISLVSILSYFLLISSEKKVFFLKTMAIHTSIIYFLVSIVLLLKNENTIVHKMAYGKNSGSIIFRKILPNIILVPIILANILLIIIDNDTVSVDFGIMLFVILLITLGFVFISSLANTMNESDEIRINLEKKIKLKNIALKKFKKTIDDSTIMLIKDSNLNITYANNAFCDLCKYSKEELIGNSMQMLHKNLNPKELMDDRLKTILKGDMWTGEVKNVAKDGSFFWVLTNIIPFENKKGKITEYIEIKKNISHLKTT
ncbi:PAS domain-containing protein [Polaribacter porphyrae]|uniref:PAS domain-containing protein n=1 Tax=Polaribacter porphyrae TaxID=1137780 RepID=A0A2S7WM47_9FLAO|nr:PAS domain-containing protein [Polaribacter porphyrae]PQJ78687.1 hypothetical protein BTO18_05580 [Polaribacter porphyrae]